MAFKIIDATMAKIGTTIMIENEPCTVRSFDVSKTGKHGHAKVRIEAVGVFDGKKRVIVRPGHERFEVPMIDKRKAQVLSINGNHASVMDLESFETLDLIIPDEDELKSEIKEESYVEYWEVEGKKAIKRLV
ncbi:translation initiation factor IF-5A [Candidatus Pacearchaeota archaeon CG1_02_32_21]|nr:MAG: translation initiation factor IF-5A [Candidatus Pacearchaeota archaeon CG1_02_32_21]